MFTRTFKGVSRKRNACWPIVENPYVRVGISYDSAVQTTISTHSRYLIVGRLYVRISYGLGSAIAIIKSRAVPRSPVIYLSESLTAEPKQPSFERIKID